MGTEATAISSQQSPQSNPFSASLAKSLDVTSTRPSTGTDTDFSTQWKDEVQIDGPCHCSNTALIVLEALNVQNVSISQQTLAHTLRLNKIALSRCKRLLSCRNCSVSSSFVMLLIVLCQNLVSSYEHVTALLMQQFDDFQSLRQERCLPTFDDTQILSGKKNGSEITTRAARNDLLEAAQRAKIQGYEIDLEEQPAVLGAITRFHLASLKTFLQRLKDSLRQDNLTSHIGLIDSACSRVNAQLEVSIKCPTRVFDI